MSNLNVYLPPYTPDYSGASSALYELGGMIILHDASGCTGNVLGYDEPRWEDAANSRALVFCSAYRHLEAILGEDDKVIDRIVRAAESLKPRFIAIVGSPVPMLLGTDYIGLAREVEVRTGIPSFGFDTKGLEFYDDGYKKATIALLKRYTRKSETMKGSVNILGLTPIDFGNLGNDKLIIDAVKKLGFNILCSFSMNFTLEDIAESAKAEFNIAISEGGVEVAEYMEKQYGIPYIAAVPVGSARAFEAEVRRNPIVFPEYSIDKKVLIIGEQVTSNSLRAELRLKGVKEVKVAIPFSHKKSLLEAGDYSFVNESDLFDIMNSGYSDIIGDPLYKMLLRRDDVRFHELPHVGISSKFHWNEVRAIVGKEMDDFISEVSLQE